MTLLFSAALVLAHVVRLALRVPILAWCLDVKRVLKKKEAWRLFTSPLDHVGLFHLLFNLWALTPAAEERERDAGPGVLSLELLFLTLASGALFVGGGEILHDLLDDVRVFGGSTKLEFPRPACAAGASGIAFGLINAAAGSPGAPPRFDLGGFSVPGRLRPWALAVAVQLMVPEVSLAGHAAGLVTGEAVSWARRDPTVREKVSRAGAAVERVFASVVPGRRRGGGGAGIGIGIGASLLPVISGGGGDNGDGSDGSSSSGRGRSLGARLAALFGGGRRRSGGGGWQAVPGEEPPRGRTTGGGAAEGGEATTPAMSPAEAAKAAAEARAAAAAASAAGGGAPK